MAAEETPEAGNGAHDPLSLPAGRKNGQGEPAPAPRRARNASRGADVTRKRTPREAPVNAIEASRRRRRGRTEQPTPGPEITESTRASAGSRDPEAPQTARVEPSRGETDPWTVPDSVRDRFVQDGHRFYFPDGAPAFKDRGRKLTTPSENTAVIASLIEIARSRGWSEVTVTGTERFRQEAWRQARLEGLSVRGYRPSQAERTQLIRALGRNHFPHSAELRERDFEVRTQVSREGAAPPAPSSGEPDRARSAPPERIVGRLLEHGRDAYRHDPQQEPSYFVRVQTGQGPREIWGKDLERAMTKSLTQPQVGDEVALQRSGQDAVTVKRAERDASGERTVREVQTHRNRWVVEKQSFFEDRARAADLVRDPSVNPRMAVRRHPELAGTYLNLRAAELASRGLRDAQDRQRFVAQVRRALAEDIERGEPLQPVRLRQRDAPRVPPSRNPEHERAR